MRVVMRVEVQGSSGVYENMDVFIKRHMDVLERPRNYPAPPPLALLPTPISERQILELYE